MLGYRKKELKEGNVIPIYLDYKSFKGFQGFARLVKKLEYDNGVATQYIAGENKPNKRDKYAKGTLISVREGDSVNWVVKEIQKNTNNKLIFTDGTHMDTPYVVRHMLDKNNSYLLKEDNYFKSWGVFSDTVNKTVFVPYSHVLYNIKSSEKDQLELYKPFEYKIENGESIMHINKITRWLVEHLNVAFPSQLEDTAYCKDYGLVNISRVEGHLVYFTLLKSDKVINVGKVSDFYVITENMRRSNVFLPYHLKTAKKIYEKENTLYTKDTPVDDIWYNIIPE